MTIHYDSYEDFVFDNKSPVEHCATCGEATSVPRLNEAAKAAFGGVHCPDCTRDLLSALLELASKLDDSEGGD